jgi:glycine cleavage system H lipoate-binding protein
MANVRGFDFPDHLHYLVEHDTWAREDADGLLTVGLTSLGGHISGDFLEFLPKPLGTIVEFNRAFGMLEMSKTLRSARTPASGSVVAINDAVKRDPLLVNREPYDAGWLARIKPSQWHEEKKSLVTGDSIAAAIERYMALHLVAEFGEALPPA